MVGLYAIMDDSNQLYIANCIAIWSLLEIFWMGPAISYSYSDLSMQQFQYRMLLDSSYI